MSDATLPFQAPPVEATVEAFEAYKERVTSFEADELHTAQRSARRNFVGMLGFAGLSGLLGLGTWGLAAETRRLAREQVVRTVLVDRAAGDGADSIQIYQINELVGPPLELEVPLIRHMAWQYVRARETYSAREDRDNFDIVTLMSTAEEQKRFKRWWEEAPDGPRREVTRAGTASIETMDVPGLRRPGEGQPYNHVVYRFKRIIRRPNHEDVEQRFVATLFFGWDHSALRADDRFSNPYGFVVSDYRRERGIA